MTLDRQRAVVRTALAAHDAGICVVPPRQDGSKAPEGFWKQYQQTRPSRDQIGAWYSDPNRTGVGFICGEVSGGLELFEFEGRAVDAGIHTAFVKQARARGLGPLLDRLFAGYLEGTPSDGIHVLYRCTETGNEKLAKRADGRDLIETKGEGGFCIVAPSNGTVHPKGGAWTLVSGGVDTIATITVEERRQLHEVAQLFDEREMSVTAADEVPVAPKRDRPLGEGSWVDQVVADYNAATTWADVIGGHFTELYTHGGITYWHHIGAEGRVGGSTNATGRDSLIVFSGTAEGRGWRAYSGRGKAPSYDRFSALVFIETGSHDTDERVEVARRLRKEGFGPPERDDLDWLKYARNADNSISALTRANGDARSGGPGTQEVPAPTSCVPEPDDERREPPAQTLSASNAFSAYVDDGPPWPDLDPVALHGPAGLALEVLEPHTEADPAAVLVTLLAAWGAFVGPNVYAKAGHVHHPPRLSAVIVGDTAKARKGTSWGAARQALDHAALQFMADRVLGGFGSGEAVVDEVRDPQPHEDDEKADPGADDKRLIVYEPEFARVLKVCQRETSILSAVLRDAWDGTRLQTRARSKKAVATGHHIAVVGHITAPELRRNLVETEIAGGFANRLLWICARRSKRLPFGGEPDQTALADLGRLLGSRADQTRDFGRIEFDQDGREMWRSLYDDMADDDPGGMLGAITARPEPQTLRLAVTYALLDGKRKIGVDHIRAGWAVWQYSRASATFIWGDAVGDEIADSLLRAIRKAGPDGLDATAQRSVFSNNVKANRLTAAREDLERRGLIQTDTVPPEGGKGRHRTVSRATRPGTKRP